MHRIVFIFLLGCLFMMVSSHKLQAQGTIRGQITDAKTGNPLNGANVFLSGTKIGDVSDVDGDYQLTGIPVGGYRLTVSYLGYQQKTVPIIVGHGELVKIDFKLKPVIYQMPEVIVRNHSKNGRKI